MKTVAVLLAIFASTACALAQERPSLTLVSPQPLYAPTIAATGRVQSLVSAKIGPRVSGRLAALAADDQGRPLDAGMSVKAGQPIFRLDDTTFRNNLAMAEAALNSAKATLANLTAPARPERLDQLRAALAELDVRLADRVREETRFKRLVEEEKTLPITRLEAVQTELAALRAQRQASESRLHEAENGPTKTEIAVADARVRESEAAMKVAQDDLRDSTVKAPFDGLITRRFKSPGDYLTSAPPTDVIELVATDQLEAELKLPEAYLQAVEVGKTIVRLRTPLLKEQLELPITRIVADIDAARGTFIMRLAIPANAHAQLVPGAFLNAEVILSNANAAVIVPQRAVLTAPSGKSAVMIADSGKMRRVTVELGDRLTEGVVVKSGLTTTQKIVVGPAESLVDGAALPEYLVK